MESQPKHLHKPLSTNKPDGMYIVKFNDDKIHPSGGTLYAAVIGGKTFSIKVDTELKAGGWSEGVMLEGPYK